MHIHLSLHCRYQRKPYFGVIHIFGIKWSERKLQNGPKYLWNLWATWLLWHQALWQQKCLLKALAVGLSFSLIPIGWCSFKAFAQMMLLSRCSSKRHPRPGLVATLCPSGAINSVIEEAGHSPAVLGSQGRFFPLWLVLFHQSQVAVQTQLAKETSWSSRAVV